MPGDVKIMNFDNELQRISADNDRLRARVEDLEYLVSAREEELNLLRIKVSEVNELKSSLENRLLELEQLNERLKEASMNEVRSEQRVADMEKELLQAIVFEKELLLSRKKEATARNEGEYLQEELKEALAFHSLAEELKQRISQLESRLGMEAWQQSVGKPVREENGNPPLNPEDDR